MAEIDFIFGIQDQRSLITFLFESGAHIVANIRYTACEPIALKSYEDISESMSSDRFVGPLFVSWDNYPSFPYQFDRLGEGNESLFWLRQRAGGPYLNFSPCRHHVLENGTISVTSGSIGYYPNYWIEDLGQDIKVHDGLKSHFRSVSKFIRNQSYRSKMINRTYWVGRHTCEQLGRSYTTTVQPLDILMPKRRNRD